MKEVGPLSQGAPRPAAKGGWRSAWWGGGKGMRKRNMGKSFTIEQGNFPLITEPEKVTIPLIDHKLTHSASIHIVPTIFQYYIGG